MRMQTSEEILNNVKKSFNELSKAVGGFNEKQKEIILPLCIETTLINNGVPEERIQYMKLFKGEISWLN